MTTSFIHLPPQVLSVVLAIGGVVLFAYSDGFTAANVEGVLLTLGAGFGAAVYKVWERAGFGAAVYKVWEGGGEGWLWSSRVQGMGGRRGGGGFGAAVYKVWEGGGEGWL